MHDALKQYENICESKPAGNEGKTRKMNFEELLENHQDSSAEYLLIKIYDFYIDDDAFNSRLIHYIQDGLFKLMYMQSSNQFNTYTRCIYLEEQQQQLKETIDKFRILIANPTELKLVC